jgi:hypothetical protein
VIERALFARTSRRASRAGRRGHAPHRSLHRCCRRSRMRRRTAPRADHAEQRMHREALVRGEIERGGRAHGPTMGPGSTTALVRAISIWDTDQNDRCTGARLTAPERPAHIGSGLTQRGGEADPMRPRPMTAMEDMLESTATEVLRTSDAGVPRPGEAPRMFGGIASRRDTAVLGTSTSRRYLQKYGGRPGRDRRVVG